MTYEEFVQVLNGGNPNHKYFLREIYKRIISVISQDDIELVYIKNLFLDYTKIELMIFTKQSKLIIGSGNEKSDVTILVKKISSIKEIKINTTMGTNSFPELTIMFDNCESIVLSSENDTNESWEYKYCEYVVNIAKYLTAKL